MDLGKNNMSIKKDVMPFKHNIDLLTLKKVSVYLFFSWLLILNISPLARIVNKVYFFASSAVVILPLFFIFQKIYKDKGLRSYNKYLIMFMLISLISCLVNFHGIPGNIKRVIWTSIYTLFIFSDDDLHEIVENIKWIFLISMFILSLISICMFFVQYSEEFILSGCPVRVGFVENRLFGAYGDPNYTSTSSTVCIYLCIQKIKENKNGIFSFINLIVQVIYMSLANSRTCQVALFISSLFFFFIFFYNKFSLYTKKNKNNVFFLSSAISVLCSFISLLLLKCTSYVLIENANSFSFNYNTNINRISLDRLDINYNHEYSNGRFAIWLNALEIFKKNWLLGISPGYVTRYAEECFPNEIIAQRRYTAMHNLIVDVSVNVGVVGVFVISIFFFKFVFSIVKWYKYNISTSCKYTFNILIASVLSILTSSFFLSEILFFSEINTFLFWLFLSEIRRKINKENL